MEAKVFASSQCCSNRPVELPSLTKQEAERVFLWRGGKGLIKFYGGALNFRALLSAWEKSADAESKTHSKQATCFINGNSCREKIIITNSLINILHLLTCERSEGRTFPVNNFIGYNQQTGRLSVVLGHQAPSVYTGSLHITHTELNRMIQIHKTQHGWCLHTAHCINWRSKEIKKRGDLFD